MSFEEFLQSLHGGEAPAGLGPALTALWWDGKSDWSKAHEWAQDDGTKAGSWVHAYLHRKEGDLSNAGYWYRRAGKPEARVGLEKEWQDMVQELLGVQA